MVHNGIEYGDMQVRSVKSPRDYGEGWALVNVAMSLEFLILYVCNSR